MSLASPEAFATYLATLSPEQVREYKALLSDMSMDENVKKAFVALLDLTEQEAIRNADAYERIVQPEVENLAMCLELSELITEIETLEIPS